MKYKLLYIVILVSSAVIMSGCGGKNEQSKEISTSAQEHESSLTDVVLSDVQKSLLILQLGRCLFISLKD